MKNRVQNKSGKRYFRSRYKENKSKIILCLSIILGVLFIIAIAMFCMPKYLPNNPVKFLNPTDYTWEEYMALSFEEQEEFKNSFSTEEEFYAWLSSNVEEVLLYPWEVEGRVPTDYSWEEYESLSLDEKEAFKEFFGSKAAFVLWEKEAKVNEKPWENDGKNPVDYTWNEYQELTIKQQKAFKDSFEKEEQFEKWLVEKGDEVILYTWEINGKLPSEYTWEEYESLTMDEKVAFESCFKSEEIFELWKENAKNDEKPWENEGKNPSEYSWKEFEKLTSEQQEAFFASFETSDELEKWLDKVGNP